MRITLTLDDDVVALLRRVQKARKVSLKAAVNEALRQGLQVAPPPRQQPYRTPPVSLGRCLVGSIDDIADTLAAEGEAFFRRR